MFPMNNTTIAFRKMNGLGNDFVVIDARAAAPEIDADIARCLADRTHGVGCDQVIILEDSPRADSFMRIRNADGSEVSACGNATRCVAALLAEETGRDFVTIETRADLLSAQVNAGEGTVTVDMGAPRLEWRQIPLARAADDTAAVDFRYAVEGAPALEAPGVVNVGNPHCVFLVDDIDAYDLAAIGPEIEHNPLFPERVNVSLAQRLAPDALRLAVWERGAGLTEACGTAACAAAVAMARKGATGRLVTVSLPGGNLIVEWRETDGHILMTGPWALDYEGFFDLEQQPALAS